MLHVWKHMFTVFFGWAVKPASCSILRSNRHATMETKRSELYFQKCSLYLSITYIESLNVM